MTRHSQSVGREFDVGPADIQVGAGAEDLRAEGGDKHTLGPKPGGQELPPDAPLLYKPFQTDHLLHAVDQILHRGAPA